MEKPSAQFGEEPDNESEKSSESRSRRQKVGGAINRTLQTWLQRRALHESQSLYTQETDEDDDDDEETSEKSETKKKTARVRRFLKLFFGKHVEKPVTQPVQPEQPPEQPIEQPETADASVGPDQTTSDETNNEASIPSQEEASAQYEVPFDPAAAAQFEQAAQDFVPPQERTEEVEVPLHREATETTSSYGDGGGASLAAGERATADRRTSTPVPETTFKRVEALNRHRNRKRRKEIRQTREDVEEFKKSQERTTKEIKREIKEVAQQREKAATPSVVESTTEKFTPVIRSQEAVRPPKMERPPESVKEILAKRQAPENTVQTEGKTVVSEPETLARAHYENLRPETVLEKVEEAAAKDIAIESLFERRHEVKDVDAAAAVAQKSGTSSGASGGFGQTGQQNTSFVPVSPVASSPPLPSVASPTASQAPEATADDYKRAARNGFATALILLIFIAMLAFIR